MFKPLAVVSALAAYIGQAASFDLTILHTNDVHARITSTDEKGELVGGVARRKTKIDEIRKEKKNVLLLDAGDQFQGTVWFNIYRGQEASHFMNLLGYDAQALGNHEFDGGSETLAPFLDSTDFPVLSCNIDASKDPLLKGKIKPWVVVEKEGRKIGIVGYTTEETVFLATPSKETVFTPVIEALPKCIEDMKAKNPDVNIIIGVGHAGYYADLKIAEAVPELDILVGGHTNTFLYMGEPVQKEEPEGPYPTVIEHADGRKTVYVTAFAFGKYLGHLDATFDDEGNVKEFAGNPILLSSETTEKYNATAEDPKMLEEVAKWEANVTAIKTEKIGTNMLYLLGDRNVCRQRECNLGNLLTDAYVHYFFKMAANGAIPYKPAICMTNGGSIRADIPEGDVSMGAVLEVVPFQNTVVVVHVPGKTLLEALEHGVGSVETGEGRFPQVSGMKYTFDASLPSGSRILEAKVPCLTCDHPELVDVDPEAIYPIIMSSYQSEGGDGYSMMAGLKRDDYDILDSDPVVDYIKTMSPLHTMEQGRITRLESVNSDEGAAGETAPAESAPAEAAPAEESSSGPSTGTILFIVGMGVVGIVIGAVVTGIIMRRRNHKASNDESHVTLS